jgi:uncharacterized protein YkwD
MCLAGDGNRRWVAIVLSVFLVVTSAAAEEGFLVLQVTNVEREPLASLRISVAGDAGPPQFTEQSGKARLKLVPGIGPGDEVELVLIRTGPQDADLVFVSPWDGRIVVRKSGNPSDVMVGRKGQKRMLEDGAVILAAHNAANQAAASAPPKKPGPGSQYRPLYGEPRLLTVVLRLGREDNTNTPSHEELLEVGLQAAALRFGFSVAEIKTALTSWGGSPLVWKTIQMTSLVEAAGTNPFPFVEATSNDIIFGTGSWSLRGCSLQSVLLKFQERDQQRFADIVGKDDSEWLNRTLKSSCEASAGTIFERMIEGPEMLRNAWREKLRNLGYQSTFQHVQVEEMTRALAQAQSQASQMGMSSDQAVAYCSYIAAMAGANMIPSQQQVFRQDVGAFKREFGRDPDEQERLLILANRVSTSLKAAVHQFPQESIAKAALLADGEATVFGHHYNLNEFGVGLRDSNTGAKLPLHDDKEILQKLAAGWIPSQHGPSPKSTTESVQPSFRQFGNSMCPAGPQPDASAEQQLLALINQERTQRGVVPVQLDARLTETARQHSAQMTQHQTISHQLEGEPPLEHRYMNMELRSNFDGENIGMGDSVSSIHRGLMNEAEHRDITLSPLFNSAGVGVLRCGNRLFVTEDYAGLSQNYSNDEAENAVQDAIATFSTNHGIPAPVRKPQPELQKVACNMAKTRSVDAATLQGLTGVRGVVAWFTADLKVLPTGPAEAVSQPLRSGYSLGTCFDNNARGYWVVMVTYQ